MSVEFLVRFVVLVDACLLVCLCTVSIVALKSFNDRAPKCQDVRSFLQRTWHVPPLFRHQKIHICNIDVCMTGNSETMSCGQTFDSVAAQLQLRGRWWRQAPFESGAWRGEGSSQRASSSSSSLTLCHMCSLYLVLQSPFSPAECLETWLAVRATHLPTHPNTGWC